VSAATEGVKIDSKAVMQNLRETTTTRIFLLLDESQRALWQSLTRAAPHPEDPLL